MNEQTVVIIKPDGVKKGLAVRIKERYREAGLHVVYEDKRRLGEPQVRDLYMEHAGKFFFEGLVLSLIGDDCIVLILQGEDAIQVVRELHGATDPTKANPGTIRHDFRSAGGPFNTVHASDSASASAREAMILLK